MIATLELISLVESGGKKNAVESYLISMNGIELHEIFSTNKKQQAGSGQTFHTLIFTQL